MGEAVETGFTPAQVAFILRSLPRWDLQRSRLSPIPGQPPSLIAPPPGCPFQPRCTAAVDRCRTETPPAYLVTGDANHLSACWLGGEQT